MICYTSCIEPYAQSEEVLKKLANIHISASEIQRITREIGGELVELEDHFIEEPAEYVNLKNKIKKLAISTDGAMVNTKDGWKEVKSCVFYEFLNKNDSINSFNKSYISRIEDCHSFAKRIKEEARKRHYHDVIELVTIGDGAKWIWELFEKEFPLSVQIVDWYHAKQHLYNLVKLIYGDSQEVENERFIKKLSDLLFYGNIKKLSEEVHTKILDLNIANNPETLADIHTELNYFINNEKRMQYHKFKTKGYPIGSGVIEATCKQLVQLRLKRNGMKWTKKGAHCILQLRCYYLGNRWNEVNDLIWKKIA